MPGKSQAPATVKKLTSSAASELSIAMLSGLALASPPIWGGFSFDPIWDSNRSLAMRRSERPKVHRDFVSTQEKQMTGDLSSHGEDRCGWVCLVELAERAAAEPFKISLRTAPLSAKLNGAERITFTPRGHPFPQGDLPTREYI